MINVFLALTTDLQALAETAKSDPNHSIHTTALAVLSHPDIGAFSSEFKTRNITDGDFNLYSLYLDQDQYQSIGSVASAYGDKVEVYGAWDFDTGVEIIDTKASLIYFYKDKYSGYDADENPIKLAKNLATYLALTNTRPDQAQRQLA